MARRLLRETAIPIGEIGYRVGFRHPANFTLAYQRSYGTSPTNERLRAQRATTDLGKGAAPLSEAVVQTREPATPCSNARTSLPDAKDDQAGPRDGSSRRRSEEAALLPWKSPQSSV
ncbi:helix-turn-helix domain-containing protein [Paenirhodobacter populi]|uniref:helix-turn-helix domain-containing protein n=1 Tax=Paenirhodobacter populi TaxID=2306993 RepID=UPI0013E3AA98|nr:helix-turn-helix domain-containing protein [Sinirhodobacter populi]